MHLESAVAQKERRASSRALSGAGERGVEGQHPGQRRARAPRLEDVGRRQTLSVFAADGRDVSAEVGSEEAVVDEKAFVKQPNVVFTRGKKCCHYTLLLLDYQKEEGRAPSHRLHWLVTDIPGEEFGRGDLAGGVVLAEYEPPRTPTHSEPRLYVLMVFEQRQDAQPLAQHPDLLEHARQRDGFPLTSWLSRNGPKMSRIAACQQFRAHLHLLHTVDCQDGELGDVEDSDDSADERNKSSDKENRNQKERSSHKSRLGRLRRLLSKRKHRSPIGPH